MPPLTVRREQQALIDRFRAVCAADDRIVAGLLTGSYAADTADAYSDVDLLVVATDAVLPALIAGKRTWLASLGEPLLAVDFDHADVLLFVLADGAEGDVHFVPTSAVGALVGDAFTVLVDKQGLADQVAGVSPTTGDDAAAALLQGLVPGFWHDVAHLITALGRGDWWWACGQVGLLRGMCVTLARLGYNWNDANAADEGYFKVSLSLPAAVLAPLAVTCCPPEPAALVQAAFALLAFYRTHAQPLAAAHGVPYPAAMEVLYLERLQDVAGTIPAV